MCRCPSRTDRSRRAATTSRSFVAGLVNPWSVLCESSKIRIALSMVISATQPSVVNASLAQSWQRQQSHRASGRGPTHRPPLPERLKPRRWESIVWRISAEQSAIFPRPNPRPRNDHNTTPPTRSPHPIPHRSKLSSRSQATTFTTAAMNERPTLDRPITVADIRRRKHNARRPPPIPLHLHPA